MVREGALTRDFSEGRNVVKNEYIFKISFTVHFIFCGPGLSLALPLPCRTLFPTGIWQRLVLAQLMLETFCGTALPSRQALHSLTRRFPPEQK